MPKKPSRDPRQLSFPWEPPHDSLERDLFFCLRPDRHAASGAMELIHELKRQNLRMRQRQEAHRLHVSLWWLGRFKGRLPPTLLAGARTAASAVKAPRFPIVFDRIHGANRHLMLRPTSADATLDFAASLRTALIKAGVRLRRPVKPHMTLSYNADNFPDLPVGPVAWMVRDFVLVVSLRGLSQHIQRGAWPLH